MPTNNRPTVNQQLTWEEASNLVKNKDVIASGDPLTIRRAIPGWNTPAPGFIHQWHDLPTDTKAMIRKSGQQAQTGWYDPATNKLTKNPTDIRGQSIYKLWLCQAKKCAYTHVECDILDMQLEHVNPGGGDHPTNWLLVKSNVNMNRKRTDLTKWVAKWEKKVAKGKAHFEAEYNKKELKNAANRLVKERILSMTEDELREFTPSKAKEWEYVHRAVGMSSLGTHRLLKNGEIRAGGSQGNYKEVLNTIALEYLHGDKELAQQMYRTAKAACADYLNGKTQNDTYVHILADTIELSKHQWVKYNREKFTKKVLRNTYKWPNVK